jgi:hypothetical protein
MFSAPLHAAKDPPPPHNTHQTAAAKNKYSQQYSQPMHSHSTGTDWCSLCSVYLSGMYKGFLFTRMMMLSLQLKGLVTLNCNRCHLLGTCH